MCINTVYSPPRRHSFPLTSPFTVACILTFLPCAQWLQNKNSCPICRRRWEFASAPKPAPATPGQRVAGEGFGAMQALQQPAAAGDPVEAD